MKTVRPILLSCSLAIAVFLIGGGLAVKVGAGENSYRQVVLFSEILSLVLDNYVDPVGSAGVSVSFRDLLDFEERRHARRVLSIQSSVVGFGSRIVLIADD